MKNTKKMISVLLVAMLLITTVMTSGLSVSAAGALASHYGTNPSGFGKQSTITVDGSFSDWSEDMLIARSAAWDCPNHWKGAHENNLADCYALFGAWDNSNLYIGMQFVNTTDTWQRPGNASLSDNGKMNDIPIMLALNTGKSPAMNGKASDGNGIWGLNIGFTTRVDHILCFSSTPGQGVPGFFKADDSGATNYNTDLTQTFAATGVSYKKADGNVCSQIWGLDYSEDPDDIYSDAAQWVDFKTFSGSQGPHNTQFDTFYEIAIPLASLGITASEVASNGVGAMLIGTRGESGMDCVPFDPTMLDNVMGSYSKDDSTSKEKEDTDDITVPLAKIGAQGSDPIPTQATTPTTPTQPTQPTQPDVPTSDLTVNAKSNLFNGTGVSGLNVGDTVNVKFTLTASKNVASAQWNLAYDSSKLQLVSTNLGPAGGTVNTGVNPVLGNFTDVENPLSFSSGSEFVNAEFKVLATGNTDVTLTVEELNVLNGSTLVSPVENGVVKSVSGVSVSGTSSVTTGSEPVTQPTTPVGGSLTVNGTSNLFKQASATFDNSTNKVTVTYQLKSSVKLIDSEWKLTYDTSKLTLDTLAMPKTNNAEYGGTEGAKTGNFADPNLIDFSTMDDFVVATFNVKGTGTTTVNLNVINLGVAKYSGNEAIVAYLVDQGTVQNVASQSGFSGYTYDTKTIINAASGFLYGDVNQNGVVEINDATLLQQYLADFTTLNSTQLRAADANRDGNVNVRDVTAIRRMLLN